MMRSVSMASFASTSSSTMNQAIDFHLTPVEREQFEEYRNHEGYLEKYGTALFAGWQKRYWKIRCKREFYLSYQKDEKANAKPNPLKIDLIKDLAKESEKKLTFNYNDERVFELRAKTSQERDKWVEALQFLIQVRDKIGDFTDERNISLGCYFKGGTPVERNTLTESDDGKLSTSGKKRKDKSYKHKNIGQEELRGVLDDDQQNLDVQGGKNDKKKSEAIMKATGISDFLEGIPEKLKAPRILYGFLGKPNRSSLKIEMKRWVFLISSRPLNHDSYLEDGEEIDEDELPPVLNFDTIYYYKTVYSVDDAASLAGEIKSIDIDNIQISDKNETKLHYFIIEAKGKKYQFVSTKRFIIEQWVDAIECSVKTAREKLYSITGKIKNISMIITNFEIDKDQLREEIEKDIDFKLWNEDMTNYKEYEEVYLTLEALDVIKDDMLYTFDA